MNLQIVYFIYLFWIDFGCQFYVTQSLFNSFRNCFQEITLRSLIGTVTCSCNQFWLQFTVITAFIIVCFNSSTTTTFTVTIFKWGFSKQNLSFLRLRVPHSVIDIQTRKLKKIYIYFRTNSKIKIDNDQF